MQRVQRSLLPLPGGQAAGVPGPAERLLAWLQRLLRGCAQMPNSVSRVPPSRLDKCCRKICTQKITVRAQCRSLETIGKSFICMAFNCNPSGKVADSGRVVSSPVLALVSSACWVPPARVGGQRATWLVCITRPHSLWLACVECYICARLMSCGYWQLPEAASCVFYLTRCEHSCKCLGG